eukprot:scaffold29901_cov63-Phaeocystis_antarctica.AAC.5
MNRRALPRSALGWSRCQPPYPPPSPPAMPSPSPISEPAPLEEPASIGAGEAVKNARCHAHHAHRLQRLHQLGRVDVLRVAVAQLTVIALAPCIEQPRLSEGNGVDGTRRNAHHSHA